MKKTTDNNQIARSSGVHRCFRKFPTPHFTHTTATKYTMRANSLNLKERIPITVGSSP
jgi:hypothetical protein